MYASKALENSGARVRESEKTLARPPGLWPGRRLSRKILASSSFSPGAALEDEGPQ